MPNEHVMLSIDVYHQEVFSFRLHLYDDYHINRLTKSQEKMFIFDKLTEIIS